MTTIQVAPVDIGGDPEFLIRDKTTFQPVPASLLGFDSINTSYLSVGFDNACVEIQPSPSSCLQEVNSNIGDELHEALLQVEQNNGISCFVPAMEFEPAMIAGTPETHEFGCNPAFVVEDNCPITATPFAQPLSTCWRSAGYHVHVGKTTIDEDILDELPTDAVSAQTYRFLDNQENHPKLAQTCDLVCGLPSVLLARDPTEKIRRTVLGYGRASEFRSPSHGFEYRTLSSWPLCSPVWTWWANASVRDAVSILVGGVDLPQQVDMAAVAEAINQADQKLAAKLWTEVKKLLYQQVIPSFSAGQAGRTTIGATARLQQLEFCMTDYTFQAQSPLCEWTDAYERDWVRHMNFVTKTSNCNFNRDSIKAYEKFLQTWSWDTNCVER